MARLTTKARETSFSSATIEVTGHHGVDEPAPTPVGLLESLFPKCLHLLVMRLQKLIEGRVPWLAWSIDSGSACIRSRPHQLHTSW